MKEKNEVDTKKGEDKYCKFSFLENGKPLDRRIHEIVVQDAEGNIHRLTGDDLPLYICGYAGVSHKDHHVLEILLSPKKLKRKLAEADRDQGYRWPVGRDMLHVILGFCLLQLMKATFLGIDVFMNTFINAFYEALSH